MGANTREEGAGSGSLGRGAVESGGGTREKRVAAVPVVEAPLVHCRVPLSNLIAHWEKGRCLETGECKAAM